MTAFNPNDYRSEDELEQNMTMSHMVPREKMNRTSLGKGRVLKMILICTDILRHRQKVAQYQIVKTVAMPIDSAATLNARVCQECTRTLRFTYDTT